jgi:uncharacterized membrane protein YfcA
MLAQVVLVLSAFLAGFIDSIAGGGGLIQLPALMIFAPSRIPAIILGTSKFVSLCGTTAAAISYARRVSIVEAVVAVCGSLAFAGSLLGAAAVARISQDSFRPIALLLLCAAALYVANKPALGSAQGSGRPRGGVVIAGAIGLAIGFYDGFFGPGTGSFLIFSFVMFFGFDFVKAAAAAKAVNVLTNVSALGYFAYHGLVDYRIALPMAAANIAGGVSGSRVALRLGSGFVRAVFLFIVGAFILKLGFDVVRQ